MPVTHHPRYNAYGVYDAHTDELVSTHDTRREADAAKGLNHHQRVRGVPGIPDPTDVAMGLGGLLGRAMFGRRR